MKKIIICNNFRANPNAPSCVARGSELIASAIEQNITLNQLDIRLERFKCLGNCAHGPNLKLAPQGRFFQEITAEKLPQLFDEIFNFSRNN